MLNKFRIKWCLSSYVSLLAKLLLVQSGIFELHRRGSTILWLGEQKIDVFTLTCLTKMSREFILSVFSSFFSNEMCIMHIMASPEYILYIFKGLLLTDVYFLFL